jgi:hypothetical protein
VTEPKKLPHCSPAELARSSQIAYNASMSTVAEIESAIQRLSPVELTELLAWLEEYQQMVNASSQVFQMYDREEAD